ncbi:MAG TPA: hypothetical protein PKZ27_03800 [Rhodocyclaceae bacterium]|nr:hypothetical protein [Rhodocyclaceae bacterium]
MSARFAIGTWLVLAQVIAGLCVSGQAMASAYEVGDTDIGTGWKAKVQIGIFRAGDELARTHPELEVGFGFADSLELAASTGYGRIETEGGLRRYGRHDTRMALKWRVRQERPGIIGIALEPEVILPTGDRSAGTGGEGVQLGLPLRLSRFFGQGRLSGQLAYVHAFVDDRRTVSLGALYEQEVIAGLWVGVEVLRDHGLDEYGGQEGRAAIGLRWQHSEQLMLFGALGEALHPDDAEASSSARFGIEYVF